MAIALGPPQLEPGRRSLGQFGRLGVAGRPGSSSAPSVQAAPAQVNSGTYQGSIVKQAPVPGFFRFRSIKRLAWG